MLKLTDNLRVFPDAGISDPDAGWVEFDVMIVGAQSIYLLEIKRFGGRVKLGPHVWAFGNGEVRPSPHASLTRRTRLFGHWLDNQMPDGVPRPWCEPLLVIDGVDGEQLSI